MAIWIMLRLYVLRFVFDCLHYDCNVIYKNYSNYILFMDCKLWKQYLLKIKITTNHQYMYPILFLLKFYVKVLKVVVIFDTNIMRVFVK